jgi:hypothetical protein
MVYALIPNRPIPEAQNESADRFRGAHTPPLGDLVSSRSSKRGRNGTYHPYRDRRISLCGGFEWTPFGYLYVSFFTPVIDADFFVVLGFAVVDKFRLKRVTSIEPLTLMIRTCIAVLDFQKDFITH